MIDTLAVHEAQLRVQQAVRILTDNPTNPDHLAAAATLLLAAAAWATVARAPPQHAAV